MHIVYIATNKFNGKRYIGASRQSLGERRRRHFYDARGKLAYCRVFYAAIRKYGESAFEWSVIANCPSHRLAMVAEIALIAALKPEYNITAGGDGIVGVPRTPEWLAKMSAALKGRKLSPERAAQCRSHLRPEQFFKSIVCLNDGLFFESVKRAGAHYGISPSRISQVLTGAQCVTSGLSFVYATGSLSDEERAGLLGKIKDRQLRNKNRLKAGLRGVPVQCVTDGKIFKSGREASQYYGISQMTISNQCRSGGRTKAGLRFMFAHRSAPVERRQRTAQERAAGRSAVLAALERGQQKIKRPVICVDDGTAYKSITDAAKSVGVCVAALSASIYRKGKSRGRTFRFVSNVGAESLG